MKKIIKLILCMGIMLVSVYLIYDYYKDFNIDEVGDDFISNNDNEFELIERELKGPIKY